MPKNDDEKVPKNGARPVGYRRPPEASRFKKGVSGNPKGRPKGSLNISTTFTKVLRERVVVNENGKRKMVTKLEAALKQLVNKAAAEDQRFLLMLLNLAREIENQQDTPRAAESTFSDREQHVIQGIFDRVLKSQDTQPEQEQEENNDNNNAE
jgi:hypothetical protein